MMTLELDHMFVAVRAGAPEIAALQAAGFQEGERNRHPGQGTASRGVFFANGYVEFLWLEDPAEAKAFPIRRTCLAQRADPGSPTLSFGFGLRPTGDVGAALPFSTWDYRPPYLPAGTAILMGSNSEKPTEPLIFVLPWKSGPGYECPQHPNGARRVTKVSLTIGAVEDPSPEFTTFCSLGLVQIGFGVAPLLKVEIDAGESRNLVDLRPAVPFMIQW